MEITPRPYQLLAIKLALTALLGKTRRALVVMATGLGKTLTAALIAKRLKPRRVLFLVHNNFILKHARDEFRKVFDKKVVMKTYNGMSKKGVLDADILFATWQTMGSNLKKWRKNHFDLIIVDEAHHSEAETYKPVTEYFTGRKLGITATPDREDGEDIRETFGPEVVDITLEEAIARGWLPRIEYHVVTDESLDENALQKIAAEIRESKRRFTMAEVNRRIFIKKRDKEIARIINGYNEKAIVFCASISHAERMKRSLVLSDTFHSRNGTSQDNRWQKNQEVLEALRNGTIRRVTAVNAFNEGVDVPSAGLVAFCRVTGVRNVFRQQLGRGLRPGKDKLIVLDFVGNLERIQLVIEMMNKVSDLHEKFTRKGELAREGYTRDAFEVSGKGFEFTFSDEVVDLMKILEKVGQGWTKEELIEQLKREAELLGRVPIALDLNASSEAGRTASASHFAHIFGSWNKALASAGFRQNLARGYTKAEAIKALKSEAKELGRTPTLLDIEKASKEKRLPSTSVYKRLFGTLVKAWQSAKLTPTRFRKTSKSELALALKNLAQKLRRVPTRSDFEGSPIKGVPSLSTYVKRFGSLGKALRAAGLVKK